MEAEIETAKVLGISAPQGKSRSALWISHAVTDGLPISALDRLVQQVAPDDKNFVYNFVSKPTLARRRKAYVAVGSGEVVVEGSRGAPDRFGLRKGFRKQAHRHLVTSSSRGAVLSPAEGAKVARLAEVWAMARRVWGSDSEARAFLFREHPLLENRRPIDVVLADEFGRPLVEQILGRLQYGSAA